MAWLKKLLDQMSDVRKTRARFQASEANIVEAFAAANACPGSALDTSGAFQITVNRGLE